MIRITQLLRSAARQYLAAACCIALSVTAYGCGDTATVNPSAQLASLAVTTGTTTATLQPAFNSATTNYTVDLSHDITNVTISAQPAVSGDTVSIDNQATTSQAIDLGQPVPGGSTTPVSIAVSGSGTSPTTYTVSLVRAGLTGNNSLQNLTVSPGTLSPAFDENVQSYTVDVANTVGGVTMTPALSDPAATMTVNGQATPSGQARTIALNPAGQPTTILVVVTAQNGNAKTYVVTVSRGVASNNNLQSLAVSPGSLNPTFSASRTSYTVNVASSVTSVTVTPTTQETTASMSVNGQPTPSGQARTIQLSTAGSSTLLIIIVTAQNGAPKTYTVGINRAVVDGNNNLSALTVSPGSLDPAFSAGTEEYMVDVASAVTSITVTATQQDSNASVRINGQPTNSLSIPLNGPGSTSVVNIVVIAQNGSQKTYTVTVNRQTGGGNNTLSDLTVSPGTLDPSFNGNTTNYTLEVASTVISVTVSATKADPNAVISGSVSAGAGTATGQAIIPLGGPGTITPVLITITAPNGNSKTYRVNVIKAEVASNNNLSALRVTPGALNPVFTPATTSYTVDIGRKVDSIHVTASTADSNAGMTVDGQGTNSGQTRSIALDSPGSSTGIEITVTAPNGSSKIYSVTVNRAAKGNEDDGRDNRGK